MSRLTLMEIRDIGLLKDEGYTQQEIADHTGYSLNTVQRALAGTTGSKQREIADRMEYFLGGAVRDSGCYRTSSSGSMDELIDWRDPTMEEAIILEEYGEIHL